LWSQEVESQRPEMWGGGPSPPYKELSLSALFVPREGLVPKWWMTWRGHPGSHGCSEGTIETSSPASPVRIGVNLEKQIHLFILVPLP
jgi:hypothetical protein